MRLPDAGRSCAVLIGVSAYKSAHLPDLPAVRNNVDDLRAVLTDDGLSGFSAERCGVVGNSGDMRRVYRILREYAAMAEDTFLVYYAGHGLTGSMLNELYLTLSDTDVDELPVTALNMADLREIFLNCRATNRVLILDCCFSGRATQGFMSQQAEALVGQLDVAGTYTLAATPPNMPALAPPGDRHTAFTGELVSLLRNGVPGGPELLSLGYIYRSLRSTMAAHGLPMPSQRGTDTADHLALVRNPGHRREAEPSAHMILQPVSPPRRGDKLVSLVVAGVTAASVIIVAASQDRVSAPSGNTGLPRSSEAVTTPNSVTVASSETPVLPTETRQSISESKVPMTSNPLALACAEGWATAFVNYRSGMASEKWLEGLRLYTTDEYFAARLSIIDPGSIPMTKVTGRPVLTSESYTSSAVIDVPTDVSKLRLSIVKTDHGWLVNEHDQVN